MCVYIYSEMYTKPETIARTMFCENIKTQSGELCGCWCLQFAIGVGHVGQHFHPGGFFVVRTTLYIHCSGGRWNSKVWR